MSSPQKSATALASFASFLILFSQFALSAQDAKSNVRTIAPGQQPVPPAGDVSKSAPPGQPDAAQKPGEKAAEKPGEKPGAKAAEPGRPRRKPKDASDPGELKVQPDDDGLISFSFKGQDWEDVLEWLADISNMSLQMEEVPPGFLNLTSRGRYEVEHVQDLINSALIGKGYTLLRSNEILHVVRLDKMDKSLVPRVDPRDLDERGTYEFVKCFFDLNALVAESTAAELGPMLSPHGKITALKTTNRLDIVETAGNMRRIRDFLAEEQSDQGKENVLREFKLRYVRATEVFETLHTVLGLKRPGPQVALTPDQIAQMQQQFMQAAQQAAQAAAKGGAAQQPGREVYLAINKSENSILANAPADKMTIIEQAVKAMDIPKNKSDSLLSNLPKLRSYKVSSVDPAALVKVLEDLGNLDPQSRLEVDTRSRSIIAYAPPIDHVTIQAIVDKIDGSGRRFEVIQLYVLDAEMVAGSIEFLMRGGEEKPRSNYNPFFFDFGYGSSRSRNERDSTDQLQVEADTERNRLLLRVTDSEMKEIRQLLTKLGELPEDDRGLQTTRVVPMSPHDVRTLIERIQNAWPSVAPNPLQVAPIDAPVETPANGTQPDEKSKLETVPDRRTDLPRAIDRSVLLASSAAQEPGDDPPPARPRTLRPPLADEAADELRFPDRREPLRRDDPPPIAITPGPNGLVISSQDTEALDQLERIIAELMPTQRVNSKIFYLKNSFCKDVADVLKDIFQEGESERKPNPYFDDMYYYYRYGPGSRDQTKEKSRLSRRRQLKFVAEPTTNTIMVLGADPAQLAEIARLIAIYDEGVQPDSNSVRITRQLFFKYTTAREVAEVVKDVFRDLLSPNDKALAKGGQQQQQQDQAKSMYSYTYVFGNESDRENARKFKGLVSMGIDDRSNTLFVSAPKDLMSIISEIGDNLDKAAGESRGVVRVLGVGGSIDSAGLLRALSGAGRAPVSANGPADKEPTGEKPQAQPQQSTPSVNRTYVMPQ